MHQVRKLIAQIRASLSENAPPLPLKALAAEYARWREEAARRLEACAGMLAKGSEHSALELAEASPPLLDLIAELSFAEEPQWQSMCARNELPVGALLDARTIAALDAVYAKGLSPNSPLYQNYRAAVTGRDDVKALHIIRTIAHVNPSDANAQSEFDRLRNKFMHAKLEAMRLALAAGDDSNTADLVDELGELAEMKKLEAQPDFSRGLAVRKRVRLAAAARELPAHLGELERAQQSGDWHRAAEGLASLEEQEQELGLTLDAAQSTRRDAVRKFVEDQRADAAEQARFLQAVEKLSAAGEQAATRAAGASTLTLAEAQELEARFDQLDHEVKQFRRTVPRAPAESINASRKAVHGAAARIRRRIAFRRVAVVAAVVIVVSAGLAWFGRAALVKSYREKLGNFQQHGQALAAQELLQQIQKHNILGIHSAPDLQAAMAETGRWVHGQAELRDQAQARIAALEQEEPTKTGAVAMYEELIDTGKLVDTLPADMAAPLKERSAAVQRKLDAHFAKLSEESSGTLQTALAAAQALLAPLSFETPPADAIAVLDKAAPELRTLETAVKHPVPVLRPDPDTAEAFQVLSKKDSDVRAELNALTAARTAMNQADTLEAYAAALASYAEVRFSETATAQPVLKDFPAPDDLPTQLLMEGDRQAWEAVKMDKAFGVAMHPQNVRQEEVSLLLALRDDPDLKDVWQCTLVEGDSVRTAFSRGPLREYVVGEEKRYSGMVWDPQEKDRTPVFAEMKLTKSGGAVNVSSVVPSVASRLLEAIKLTQLTEADGTHWARSAFEVIHDVVHAPADSAIARAILMQHLDALMAQRPYEWGLHYCPNLRRDLAELDALCEGRRLNTYEWMLPATIEKLDEKLSAYFTSLLKRDYLNEALRVRDAALEVRGAGAVYAGFVDGDGNARLLQNARAAPELWCLGAKHPVLLQVTPGTPNAGLGAQTKGCRPFSPLFHIPTDRAALLQRLRISVPSMSFFQAP